MTRMHDQYFEVEKIPSENYTGFDHLYAQMTIFTIFFEFRGLESSSIGRILVWILDCFFSPTDTEYRNTIWDNLIMKQCHRQINGNKFSSNTHTIKSKCGNILGECVRRIFNTLIREVTVAGIATPPIWWTWYVRDNKISCRMFVYFQLNITCWMK